MQSYRPPAEEKIVLNEGTSAGPPVRYLHYLQFQYYEELKQIKQRTTLLKA